MPPTPAGCSYYLEARGKRDTITRPLTLLSGLKSGYAHIQRVFRVAVKVFGSGRDLCIGIIDQAWRPGLTNLWRQGGREQDLCPVPVRWRKNGMVEDLFSQGQPGRVPGIGDVELLRGIGKFNLVSPELLHDPQIEVLLHIHVQIIVGAQHIEDDYKY